MPGPDSAVRYENNVLQVGGVAFRQFPNYRTTELRGMPVGWPSSGALLIDSVEVDSGLPLVSAAVLRSDHENSRKPDVLLRMVDESFGDEFLRGELVADEMIRGSERTCHLRVRIGFVMRGEPGSASVVGTVIAIGGGRPTIGMVVDAGPDQPVEPLTREIAATLCGPPV